MNSTAHVGAAGELFACQYFLAHGLEVFRNVAASGPVDLFVYNKQTQLSVPVDVKSQRTPYIRADGSILLSTMCMFRNDGVWQVGYIHGEDALRLPAGFWEALGME